MAHFSISAVDCAQPIASDVWLTFGGDVPEQTIYCCGDHSRKKRRRFVIQGRSIGIKKNAALHWFIHSLNASRNRQPNGEPCEYGACKFYRVSATLTGWFFAKSQEGGYGHLGCCSLLVIDEVADVEAKRTQVPAGGEFSCDKQVWEFDTKKAQELGFAPHCSDGTPAQCEAGSRSVMKRIAEHWGRTIDLEQGDFRHYREPDSDVLSWQSDDLLTRFGMKSDHPDDGKTSVTAEICRTVNAVPEANSLWTAVTCDEKYVSARDGWSDEVIRKFNELLRQDQYTAADDLLAEWDERLSRDTRQGWRTQQPSDAGLYLLNTYAKRWHIVVSPLLRFDKCGDASLAEQTYSILSCSWYSGDGMQTFDVGFMQRKSRTGTSENSSALLLASVGARTCSFSKAPELNAMLR